MSFVQVIIPATFLLLYITLQGSASVTGPYNIVLILVDDLRHLSDENINLRNIKKIAAEGVNFKNAFAQVGLLIIIINIHSL